MKFKKFLNNVTKPPEDSLGCHGASKPPATVNRRVWYFHRKGQNSQGQVGHSQQPVT